MQDVAFESLLSPEHAVIDYLIAADFAEVINGKSYIIGGGWDRFSPASYPVQMRLGVAVGIRVPYLEANLPHHFVLILRTGDGKELLKIEGDLETGRAPGSRGEDTLVPIAANAQVEVPEPNLMELIAQVGESTKRISIRAVESPGSPSRR